MGVPLPEGEPGGPGVLDQRDIEGEFIDMGDEFLRAVQRIDQPEAAPGPALRLTWRERFRLTWWHSHRIVELR